jgi:RNA polymerase sigma-70 factor, ECF subfamily
VRAVGPHSHSVGDEELVLKVARGELAQLGQLFDLYHLQVRRFLARLQVPAGDLDDLVQLTFLQVPRAATRFDPQRSVKSWLFGLATFVVKRHRRSLARITRKIAALAREPSPGSQLTPAELVGEMESARRADRALAALSAKKREVFVMVVLEKLPGEAVAHALGIPEGTVWTRLHHARRELQELLREDEP